MCGISGFANYNNNLLYKKEYWLDVLCKMRKSLAHRGEDDFGEYVTKNVGLSHTRLAIRDIINGKQPMTRVVNGKSYIIVYNGEIYNAEDIKQDIDYKFSTTSDTEVILLSYIKYGNDFVNKLNGIFSFAIYDESKNIVVCYRDRVGIKPLFYTIQNGSFIFASEIKALFCFPDIEPEIDINSLREIFAIGPARTAGNGVFKNISEVLPGHYIIYSKSGIKDIEYWNLASKSHKENYEETVDHVRYLVKDSIERQMVSDVPVCSFLSGGIDSSIVTAFASKFLEKQGKVLNTFSFDFKGNDKYFKSNSFQPERDKSYVDIMLKNYNLNHTVLECDEADLAKLLFNAVEAKDLPGMADVDASLLYFCSVVKKYNKVTLTGECADEIFGGYPWFYRKDLLMGDGFPWSKNPEVRVMLLKDELIKELNIKDYIDYSYNESIKKVQYLDTDTEINKRERMITYLNIKWFMQTLLDRMDRTSMYSGLEARVPFADHRIIEYVFNVPWKMKYQNNTEKMLLRDACKDILPKEILYRKKSPYPKTYNPNYLDIISKMLDKVIENPSSPILNIIDVNKTKEFLKAPFELGKPWFGQLMTGPQLIAYMLQINCWMDKYNLNF